jgi:hypothetical protein
MGIILEPLRLKLGQIFAEEWEKEMGRQEELANLRRTVAERETTLKPPERGKPVQPKDDVTTLATISIFNARLGITEVFEQAELRLQDTQSGAVLWIYKDRRPIRTYNSNEWFDVSYEYPVSVRVSQVDGDISTD